MRVVLIHNPSAGSGDVDPRAIAQLIASAGHSVTTISCADDDWQSSLDRPHDLVAVNGGDGTIARVAKLLAGRDITLAALPAGTANNIAFTLGLAEVSYEDQIAGWANGRSRIVDVGRVSGPFGERRIIEAVGCGLFASSIGVAEDSIERQPQLKGRDRVAHALEILAQRAAALPTTHVQAQLDDNDISGDYIVFEAMNTQFVGPNLFLAPDADPGDGLVDVVLVSGDERDTLVEHLASWRRGDMTPPPLRSERGRSLVVEWSGFSMHLDDEQWPDEGAKERRAAGTVNYEITGVTVRFVVP